MKRLFLLLITCLTLCSTAWAVPADPRLLRELLENGDTARYEQMVNHERKQNEQMRALPKKMQQRMHARRAPQATQGEPNLAKRGLLIMVNYSDTKFKSNNAPQYIEQMMNGEHYSYISATGSVAQYYSDQSNGTYRPVFDVVGPVDLPNTAAHYGKNNEDGRDQFIGDLVYEACKLASELPGVDLSKYDEDNDGLMDFVYLLYAGKGEADGGGANTIWPCSGYFPAQIYQGYTSYFEAGNEPLALNTDLYTFDGVAIWKFACSAELNGQNNQRTGIGTITHEFGHVLGLPDVYDVNYGSISETEAHPGYWDLMASGSYNNDGKTPPNLSPWEKAFLGWTKPINAGKTAQSLKLYDYGTTNHNIYQLNASGTYQNHDEPGVCYYIENRQQTGWDAYLPGHGMLIWKLDYDESLWDNNVLNTYGLCHYTVVSATGKTSGIGSDKDPFPGANNVTSWNGLSGKPLLNIEEKDGVITLDYISAGGAKDYTPTNLAVETWGGGCKLSWEVEENAPLYYVGLYDNDDKLILGNYVEKTSYQVAYNGKTSRNIAYWAVIAVDADDNELSSWAYGNSFTILPPTVQLTNMKATPNDMSCTFSWTSNADYWELVVDQVVGEKRTTVYNKRCNSTTKTLTLDKEGDYEWYVYCYDNQDRYMNWSQGPDFTIQKKEEKVTLTVVTIGEGTVNYEKKTFDMGTKITLKATPKSGNEFICWSSKAAVGKDNYDVATVDLELKKDLTLAAIFVSTDEAKRATLRVTIADNQDDWGIVKAALAVEIDSKKVYIPLEKKTVLPKLTDGIKVRLTAEPEEGYRFLNWNEDKDEPEATRTLSVKKNTTWTAYFEKNAEGVEDVDADADVNVNKRIVNGELIITRGDKEYNILGGVMRK